MSYAPLLTNELDPIDSNLTEQRYVFRYIDLCHQLGFQTYSSSDETIRSIDAQIAQAALKRGLSDDDIELTIWYGSQIARRMSDGERDIYVQSFTVKAFKNDEQPEITTVFVDETGDGINPFEAYSVLYRYQMDS